MLNKVYTDFIRILYWIFQNSENVSEYNLTALFYELAHNEKYVEPEPKLPADDHKKDDPTKQPAKLTGLTTLLYM